MGILGPVITLLVVVGIIVGVVALIRRGGKGRRRETEGNDIIAYLLLALTVGTAGFSLSALGQVAFPGTGIIFDPSGQIAGALAALVVSGPIAIFLWRRQAKRREEYPNSTGWTIYLAIMEGVFLTSLVVAAVSVIASLLGDPDSAAWTDVVIFGGIVAFHEFSSRRTPPLSGISELPRVVGSAVGLVTLATGLGGLLDWAFTQAYESMASTNLGGGLGVETSIASVIVGGLIWWYRWWRTWDGERTTPRNLWISLMSISGLTTAVGALVVILGQTLVYLLFDTAPAGSFFEFLPATMSTGIVGALIWAHHRQRLGDERTDSLRAYQYAMSAAGLGSAIGAASALASVAFGPSGLVGRPANAVLSVSTILVAGLIVWYRFWRLCSAAPRAEEAATAPRRFYVLGFAVISGLTSAGALIATLVVVFQWMLGDGGGDNIALQAALFLFAGLATWHLLTVNAKDRSLIADEEIVTPFDVTIICSDPGPLAGLLPGVADLTVIYRSDEAGVVDEDMGEAIVAQVANRPSLVWVDADGFRVAPAR